MKAGIAVVVLVAAVAAISLTLINGTKDASLRDQNLKIDDIRGDHLGMTRAEYSQKHFWDCSHDADCIMSDTYAGISATKDASFLGDGRLWKISYSMPGWSSGQIIAALKEKYGNIEACGDVEMKECRWTNGKQTIRYIKTQGGASVAFVDESLSDQFLRDYEAEQAAKRKSDQ